MADEQPTDFSLGEDEPLSGALQENVLTMLCFDPESSTLIRRIVDSQVFESVVYKKIADRACLLYTSPSPRDS